MSHQFKLRDLRNPKDKEDYQNKPQVATKMIRQLQALGFQFELVLTHSLHYESTIKFVNILNKLKLLYYAGNSQQSRPIAAPKPGGHSGAVAAKLSAPLAMAQPKSATWWR